MVAAADAPDLNNAVINVGSGVDTSVRDLARIVMGVTDGEPEIVNNSRGSSGPARMCADLTLAGEKLNYKPKTSLETGLQITLERDRDLRQKNQLS